MKIQIKLFASVRDSCGYSEKIIEYPGPLSVEKLLQDLFSNIELSNKKDLLVAINENYASPDSIIKNGDIVAIFPPVSGG